MWPTERVIVIILQVWKEIKTYTIYFSEIFLIKLILTRAKNYVKGSILRKNLRVQILPTADFTPSP